MADKLNGRVQAIRDRCGITEYEPYIQAAALFFYRGDYKALTRELKYNAELPLGRYVAGILGRKLSGSGLWDDVDVVIPVPLHWWRRYRRGYNQAEVIAREVAAKGYSVAYDTAITHIDSIALRRIRCHTADAIYEEAVKMYGKL